MRVPIARANLTDSDISSVLEPLETGWLVQGPKVQDFEQKWSQFTASDHSIAVTSCTTGLNLALSALGIGPGDEVIVPAFTWISTANVVEHLGATVVFCDINPRTFNIDIGDVSRKITTKTKAIMPVHLFGLSAEMDGLAELAATHKLFLVEDAACGFGATYRGRHVGTFGDAGVFSFHPRKAITTGEGGMVTTSNAALANRMRRLRDHGATVSDLQRHSGQRPYLLPEFPDAGYNFRMTDLQGALGSAQMSRAHEIVNERRRLAARYDSAFSNLEWLETPFCHEDFGHGYQSYACLFRPDEVYAAVRDEDVQRLEDIHRHRDKWMDSLQLAGISTRPATHAVHMLEFYRDKYQHAPQDFFGAYAAYTCSISLPLFHGLREDEQDYVISEVVRFEA